MPGDGELQKNDMRALEWLLRLVCAVMFLGHGWMAYNGQMPLRALLWDEALVAGGGENLTGMNWDTWVSSMRVDAGIDAAIRIQAWVYLLLCVAALLPVRNRWLSTRQASTVLPRPTSSASSQRTASRSTAWRAA